MSPSSATGMPARGFSPPSIGGQLHPSTGPSPSAGSILPRRSGGASPAHRLRGRQHGPDRGQAAGQLALWLSDGGDAIGTPPRRRPRDRRASTASSTPAASPAPSTAAEPKLASASSSRAAPCRRRSRPRASPATSIPSNRALQPPRDDRRKHPVRAADRRHVPGGQPRRASLRARDPRGRGPDQAPGRGWACDRHQHDRDLRRDSGRPSAVRALLVLLRRRPPLFRGSRRAQNEQRAAAPNRPGTGSG